ncbi:hypothetical protein [Phaeovulum sp. NW3]|uniref:hypothetical protein n=1 Tax=Phaeovulum sp. NW3 TaxID=2934933 RepID=UPI002021B582|nr:hypothetical protein [Phaeovulum sp. NW3]MCL7464101.1 hypothetical protein [Phaeovulum sp. NW3]
MAVPLAALIYANGNEDDIVAFWIFTIIFGPFWLYFYYKFRNLDTVLKNIKEISSRRRLEAEIRAEARQTRIKALGKYWRVKLFAGLIWSIFLIVLLIPLHIYRNPKKVFAIIFLGVMSLGGIYLIGLSGGGSGVAAVVVGASEVAHGVAEGGNWVLHSSGGYILQRGGRFVAGTLRETLP